MDSGRLAFAASQAMLGLIGAAAAIGLVVHLAIQVRDAVRGDREAIKALVAITIITVAFVGATYVVYRAMEGT